MQAQIAHREKAIQKKDEDQLRNALRMKRDEVLDRERQAIVRERLIAKVQEKNMKESEKIQKQEEIKLQKLYDKMLVAVEKQMNEELTLAQKKDIVEGVKMDLQQLRKAQSQLWR